jgi:hypothetical protein
MRKPVPQRDAISSQEAHSRCKKETGMRKDSKKRKPQSPSSNRKRELVTKKRSITIGMDLGDKRSRYCVLEDGEVVKEDSVATRKKELGPSVRPVPAVPDRAGGGNAFSVRRSTARR